MAAQTIVEARGYEIVHISTNEESHKSSST